MRLLIINTARLEEVILTLPVLDYLQQICPGIEVDCLVDKKSSGLLTNHPCVTRKLECDASEWRLRPLSPTNLRRMISLRRELRQRNYDLVFDLDGTLVSGLSMWATGCSRRYGFDDPLIAEPINQKFRCNRVPMRSQERHISDKFLRLISVPFGKNYNDRKLLAEVAFSKDDELSARLYLETLPDGLVFVLHTGGACNTRLWHPDSWTDLGSKLLDRYPEATILVSWGEAGSRDAANQIVHAVGQRVRLLEYESLLWQAAFLKMVDLVVGGDTAPIHLAAAMGTPTVSFYRSTDSRQRAPRGGQHRAIQSPFTCSGCLQSTCSRDFQCRESIAISEVSKAIDSLMSPL